MLIPLAPGGGSAPGAGQRALSLGRPSQRLDAPQLLPRLPVLRLQCQHLGEVSVRATHIALQTINWRKGAEDRWLGT